MSRDQTAHVSNEFSARKLAAFEKAHGFRPNIDQPVRFTEKLLRRIILDDDPCYRLYATKLISPHFCASRGIPGLHFAKRYKVLRRLAPSDFPDLPSGFVLKSSFASGLNKIVFAKSDIDIEETCNWFNSNLFTKRNAQGRTDPENCVIVEELLHDHHGEIPADYKLHCLRKANGSYNVFIQLDSDRFGDHRQVFLDEDFEITSLAFGVAQPHETLPERPGNLADLLRIGKSLAEGFDYVRVDLYSLGTKIYFGEITPFPHGGARKPTLDAWDFKLGAMWTQTLPAYTPG